LGQIIFFVIAPLFFDDRAVLADWKADWEKLIQAAKKEGQVTVYSSFAQGPAAQAFTKQFSEIKYVLVNNTGSQISNRVMAERRAGKPLADVIISGANTNYQVFYAAKILEPIRPGLILPEVVDPSGWWQGKHWYVDAEAQYVFVYLGNVARVGSYNTKTVAANELQSYWDFSIGDGRETLSRGISENPAPAAMPRGFFSTSRSSGRNFCVFPWMSSMRTSSRKARRLGLGSGR
jgi:hypothetical protein